MTLRNTILQRNSEVKKVSQQEPAPAPGGDGSCRSAGDHKTAPSEDLDTFTVSAALTFWRTESIVESCCPQILSTRHPSRFN
jgi:hypothetical protein